MKKLKQELYNCPSCDYSTALKGNMRAHFNSKSHCPRTKNDITLTDEIKEYVLSNRIYRVPDPIKEMLNMKICEKFYQQILEKHYRATHKKLKHGISDITTNDAHIEIKEWDSWIYAVGQLQVYNIDDPKERLRVFLFGKYSKACKKNAFEIFKFLNIEVYDCINETHRIKIENFETKEVLLIQNL